jgi:triacylglycerol lipase
MNLTSNTIPTGFDKEFALTTALPLAEAAYAVMQNPGQNPKLPDGYQMTAAITAHPDMLAALNNLEAGLHAQMMIKLLGNSNIFGLIGNNPGERIAFISFRGTQDFTDWEHDLDALYEPYGFVKGAGDVHMGFREIYKLLRDSIGANLEAACQGCDRLFVTGHSMGAALAVLSAPDLVANFPPRLTPQLITFAGPRTGLLVFHHFFNKQISVCYRVVASHDIVPQVPLFVPPFFMYEHVGAEVKVDGGQEDPVQAHSLELSYKRGLEKL